MLVKLNNGFIINLDYVIYIENIQESNRGSEKLYGFLIYMKGMHEDHSLASFHTSKEAAEKEREKLIDMSSARK